MTPDVDQDSEKRTPETLAQRQIANARRDPRLALDRNAVVADWWAAMEAAERTRIMSMLGIRVLAKNDSEGFGGISREQRELARADIDNEFAELNAMTLVALVSALDALIEGLAPRAREMMVAVAVSKAMDQAREQLPEEHEKVDPQALEKLKAASEAVFLDKLGKIGKATGSGAARWETVLRHAGLSARGDRTIPNDLDETLCELVSLRHVVVHRAGRIDERALRDAPTLRHGAGDLVRINGAEYRRYAAAIRTYGDEVVYRVLRGVGCEPPNLLAWRENYLVGS